MAEPTSTFNSTYIEFPKANFSTNLSDAAVTNMMANFSTTWGLEYTTIDPHIYPSNPYVYTAAPSILLSIIVIFLNIFVINYYRKTELTVVPLLYTIIASLDILCAIGTFYKYVVVLLEIFNVVEDRKVLEVNAMIFFFLMQISSRCSVFCNLVLAVSRTIMILDPFYQMNIKSLKLACILYCVPWIVLYGINLYVFYRSYFDYVAYNGFLLGTGLFMIVSRLSDWNNWLLANTMFILPDIVAFIIPVIIVIITCLIQVVTLHRSSQFPTSSNQRHVTITVLLMSSLFVACNSPLCVHIVNSLHSYIFTYWGWYPSIQNIQLQELGYASVTTIIFATILPLLNGTLNPFIIISRSNEMRQQFLGTILEIKRCFWPSSRR